MIFLLLKNNAAPAFRRVAAASFMLAILALPLLLASATAIAETVGHAASKKTHNDSASKKNISKKTGSKKAVVTKTSAIHPHKKKQATILAQDRATQNEMTRVQEQIRSAEQRIKLTREQREQKELEVKQAETEIGAIKSSVGSVQTDVSSREGRLEKLRLERVQRQSDRVRLVNLIKADLQMAQRQGGQDYYKLLFNQQDPQTVARLMKYYGYLQKARAERVQALNETMARLDVIAREEEENVLRLRSLRGELQEKQSRLASAQQQRNQAIRVLSTQIETEDERLQKLRRDQQALQSVMDRLAREAIEREQRDAERRRQEQARAAAQVPRRAPQTVDSHKATEAREKITRPDQDAPVDFKPAPYHGRCPLPVAGAMRSSFGSARAGGLRWNGVVIAAAAGTPVRAIRPGRVAFADYLRGYGFLIIVDHGRGMMSLYGQNQSLQKKAGDDVGGNEVIATVGDSGGNDADGLYFEIRMRGRPTDPAGWCGFQ